MRNVLNRMKNKIHFFAIFIFRVTGENSSQIGVILSTKMTITRKMKIAKIGNLIFLSIQSIPDLSFKFEKNWKFCTKKKFLIFLVGGLLAPYAYLLA